MGASVLVFVAAVAGVRFALGLALLGFVAGYCVALAGHGAIDARAPLLGAGLLVSAELASRSGAGRRGTPAESLGQSIENALAAGLIGVVAGALVLAASVPRLRGGLGWESVAAGAAIGVFALLARSSRRLRHSGTSDTG